MIYSRRHIVRIVLTLLVAAGSLSGRAQSLVNEKIQIAADALTVLKFNGEITHCELGMRDGFTCLVRDNDNTVVIKTLEAGPASTNLAITEGKRTHYFILIFLKKIDINNTKLFYDFSDLKALKKLVAKKAEQGESQTIAAEVKSEPVDAKKSKKEEAAEKKRREAEQKKIDDELARVQEQQRQKDLALKKEQESQKALALAKEEEKTRAAAEKTRKAQEAKDAARAKAAEDKKLAANKKKEEPVPPPADPKKDNSDNAAAGGESKKLSRREERELKKQQEREAAEAAAKAEQARKEEEAAAAAKEKARVDELERQQMIALEKERKKNEAAQKQRDAAAAKVKAQEDARAQQQELAKAKAAEKEAARMKQQEAARIKSAEAEQARMKQQQAAAEAAEKRQVEIDRQKAVADALAKEKANPLAYGNLRKKYPTINFADIPQGQMITGEYFRASDTLENYQRSQKLLAAKAQLNISSEAVDGVDMKLEDIDFSGVNAYLKVRIRNQGKEEYLAGRMILRWYKGDGSGLNLFACYVTQFPVIGAGSEATIVYVARGVNAQDADKMYFSITDRVHEGRTMEIPFTGKVYNKEFMRK